MSLSEVDFGEKALPNDFNSLSIHYLPAEVWGPKDHFDNEH